MQKGFGDRLLYLLSKKDMTQKDLAIKLGVNPATINKYIKGTRFPDEDIILKLSEYFDTTIDYLYGKTDDPKGYVIVKQNDKYEISVNKQAYNVSRIKLEELLEKLIEIGIKLEELE